jgi:hypothetical protein
MIRPSSRRTGSQAMARPDHPSSILRRLSAVGILVICVLLAPVHSSAEIILDDFVDGLRIDVPEQDDEWFRAASVGDLTASLSARVISGHTKPFGFLDINLIEPSALTANIPNTMHTNVQPSIAIHLLYSFDPVPEGVDLSQGGANNAVILDFGFLTADVPLNLLEVSVRRFTQIGSVNTSTLYTSTFQPIPQSDEPFSLIFPFESFRVARGGEIPDFDFSSIVQLSVFLELALVNPNLPEELNFQMVVKRISVGYVVPEPPTFVGMVVLSILVWSTRYSRVYLRGFLLRDLY